MVSLQTLIISIFGSVFASTGFWAFVTAVWQTKQKRKSAESRMILGLAYREISQLCESYIQRGGLSIDEYQDLKKYLFEPYREMGGNGTCERLMKEVEKLPISGRAGGEK